MLRPYQTKAIDLMRTSIAAGKKRVILCAPTGSGKTVMFTYMVARALERGKQAIIVHGPSGTAETIQRFP
jgi:Superfamily II RNA helicase